LAGGYPSRSTGSRSNWFDAWAPGHFRIAALQI